MESAKFVLIPLFFSAILPLIVAIVAAFAGFSALKNQKPFISGIAIALGFIAGFWGLVGFTSFPPRIMSGWLPYIGTTALLLNLIASKTKLPLKVAINVVLIAGFLFIQLKPLYHSWETGTMVAWTAGIGFVWLLFWFLWDQASTTEPENAPISLAMVALATTTSLINVLDGSVLIGQLAGMLASACGGVYLLRFKKPELLNGSVTAGIFTALIASLLINAYFYVEVSWIAVGLVSLSGLGILAIKWKGYKDLSQLKQTLYLCGITLLPGLIAIGYLAYLAATEEPYY